MMFDYTPASPEYQKLLREVWDMRDEVRRLRDQLRNDDEYLELLTRAEDMSEQWKERLEARRMWLRKDWPDFFKDRA